MNKNIHSRTVILNHLLANTFPFSQRTTRSFANRAATIERRYDGEDESVRVTIWVARAYEPARYQHTHTPQARKDIVFAHTFPTDQPTDRPGPCFTTQEPHPPLISLSGPWFDCGTVARSSSIAQYNPLRVVHQVDSAFFYEGLCTFVNKCFPRS